MKKPPNQSQTTYHLEEIEFTTITDIMKESSSDFLPVRDSTMNTYDFLQSASKEQNFYLYALKSSSGDIAGYISNLKYKDELTTAAIGPMYIVPKYRGLGLGQYQVELFLEVIKRKGFKEVITKTWGMNKGSRRIFEKLGFKIDKIKENDRTDGDSTIKYVKLL